MAKTPPTSDPADTFKRPALDLLAELNRGKTAAQLTDEIHKALTEIANTGRPATVTLTLKIEPDKKAADERIFVTPAITSKLPRLPEAASLFYLTDDHNLTRSDPKQPAFEGMRAVDDIGKDARSRAAGDN